MLKKLISIGKYDFFDSNLDIHSLFRSINEVVNEDFDLYENLVHSDSHNFLLGKVKTLLKDSIVEKYILKNDFNKNLFNLYAEYTATGIMSMYIEWFNTESNISLMELGEAAEEISFKGFEFILNK